MTQIQVLELMETVKCVIGLVGIVVVIDLAKTIKGLEKKQ